MRPSLLLNENFPAPSVSRLRQAKFDAASVSDYHTGLTDEAVLAWAVREMRWIVTFDRDYGELIFRRGLPPPPTIILLRVQHYRPQDPAQWIIDLMASAAALTGQFVVYTGESLRKRPMLRFV